MGLLIMMSQYVSAAKGDFTNWSGSDASKTLTAKLTSLLGVMEADLEKIVALENKRQADFAAFLLKVNKNIAELKANIKTLVAQIKSNTECVVRQTLNLMNVRFGKVPKRMVDYLDSVEAGFAEYENKTKLIAFKIYKYLALNENAMGKDITADTQAYVDNKKFL